MTPPIQTDIEAPLPNSLRHRNETFWALGYFSLYFVYLFIFLESESGHWISLVVLPVLLLVLYQRTRIPDYRLRDTFASIGLERRNLTTGVGWAILLGFGLSALQLIIGSKAQEAIVFFKSGDALWMIPLVFGLLLVTVGITEEVFFRGVLQTRFSRWLGSPVKSVLIVSVLFSIYHIPYAYLNPNWQSSGDLMAATASAFANGMLGGVVLGIVYERTRHNLVACVLVHALIDVLPAMTMVKFSG